MSVVNEIKCARCDRKYSGVRSRCPYCGARRIGRGKYTEDSENAKGKMLISILIMLVFAVGISILLLSNPNETDAGNLGNDVVEEPEEPEDDPLALIEEPPEEPPEEPIEDIIITPQISSLVITFSNRPLADNEFTMWVGDRDIPLNFSVEPPGAESGLDIEWWSENTEVAEINPAPGMGGLGAEVKAIGRGTSRLFVAVGDFEAEVLVRVRER